MSFDQRDGSAGLPDGFAELPPLVYADDPRWIPEDPQFLRLLFSPANPWLARGRARHGRRRAGAGRDRDLSAPIAFAP